MEENRKIEILNSLIIFFRNHQRYEMAAYIRRVTKSVTKEYYLSDTISDPSINNTREYEFAISIIDGYFMDQYALIARKRFGDQWAIEQYKNLITNTKRVKRILTLEKIGI